MGEEWEPILETQFQEVDPWNEETKHLYSPNDQRS